MSLVSANTNNANAESMNHAYLTKNVNQEFNQYLEYYLQMINLDHANTILIVEDDPFSRKLIEASVEQYNPEIKCFSAVSEKQAMEIIRSVNCDLVIADYFLEGERTGLDLCDEIYAISPNTKCLIVSKLKDRQYREIAKYSKAPPEFVEKPVSIDFFKKYLSNIFGGNHVF